MRNPLNKALWSLGLAVLGAGLTLLVYTARDQIGDATTVVVGSIGAAAAVIFVFIFFWALLSAVGYARLTANKNPLARWHVTADEWDRFRTFDAIRAAEHPSLRNDMRIRKQTPPKGVDVIVGRHSLIVDGSYHGIMGRAFSGRDINWLNAPADPECIEFPKSYPRSRGGSLDLTLRVPVPASARPDGVRVFEHYRSKHNRP
ncbi:MAG: hypothetical protein ABIQ97_02170 [Lysobacteraceae bacterium]